MSANKVRLLTKMSTNLNGNNFRIMLKKFLKFYDVIDKLQIYITKFVKLF